MEQFIPLSPEVLAQYESEPPKYDPVQRESVSQVRYVKTGDSSFRYEKGANGNEAVISCVGDMLCEEKLFKAHHTAEGFYFDDVFQFVRPIFRKTDLVIGNLETTICESAPYTGEQYKIDGKYHCNAPVEFLDAIKQAGFDFLIMSNNHNCDSGVNGLLETLHHVDQRGFMRTGVFAPQDTKRWTVVDVNGIKLAILAYSTWFNRNEDRFTPIGQERLLNAYSRSKAKEDIRGAKADGAEFVLVYMHWGTDAEYKIRQSASMQRMAQELADCGADYIVGSHTHSIQPYKVIYSEDGRDVPCVYSMGNFVTSEMSSVSRKNAILQLTLHKENGEVSVRKETLIPCFVPDKAFGCSYPVLPESCILNNETTAKALKKAADEIRDTVGSEINFKPFLTTARICSILGVQSTVKNRAYTTLNFAMDARKDGVVIISEITSDPNFQTSDERCAELADLAIEKGAALLISNRQIKDYPCIVVDSVFDAFCRIITAIRIQFSPKTISITGSIGKTTSTEMVYSVLRSNFNTHRNTGSANNVRYVGTVIQQLKSEHEVYVQETMEGPPYGACSTIARMVRPQAAIVTVVGTSHMEAFGSQERIQESCLGVQDGMPEDGLLILNGDDPFQWNAKCDRKAVYYAIDNEQADYRAVNIRGEGQCLAFDILYGDDSVSVRLHCFGKHNVLNAVAAFAAGKWAGMSDREIVTGLEKYRTGGIRQNLVQYGGYRIFLDCYNAAPESMKSAFNALEMIEAPEGGRRVAVLADMKELGEKTIEIHQSVGRMVLDSCIDVLICYGECAYAIAEVVRTEGNIPVFHTEDAQELVELLKKEVTQKDITIFKGSHGMALEHIVDLTWGTWFHEEFERYDFMTKYVSDNDLQYCVYTDHVSVEKKVSTVEEVVIPDYVEGLPVTSLSRSLFEQSKYTKAVTLPNNLVNIRYCAFYKANGIQTIHIPASVRIIDTSAFSTCENLIQATIEEGCTHIGRRAFGNCKKLESITIPSTVRQIGEEAFLNCDKLTIYGEEGSYVQQYSEAHGIPFVLVGDQIKTD